jgi:hypothetical protein
MKNLALLLIPSVAFAQGTIDQPIDSIRAPFMVQVTYSATIQMETINASTGSIVLTGTAAKLLGIDIIKSSVLLADMPGNKTVATTVVGLRASFAAVPAVTSGWAQVAPFGIRVTFKTPLSVPAGSNVGCRYDMPAQTFDPVKLVWSAVAAGNIKCAVGVKAADLPAPGPVVVGTIPPPPPPPTGDSVLGDCSPPLSQLTLLGSVWTISGGVVSKDKIPATSNAYSDLASICVSGSPLNIRAISPTHGYECWGTTGWVSAGC